MFALVEAIFGGYLAALVTLYALGFLITREGRGVLMRGDCMSPVYYTQLGLSWMVAGAAASVIVLHFFPAAPMGIVLVTGVAFLLATSLVRSHRKAPQQQTLGASILLVLCIAAGCAAGCALRLKG